MSKGQGKRRIVRQAVLSGITSMAEIRKILARYGKELDGAVILDEIERTKRWMERQQDQAESSDLVEALMSLPETTPAPARDPAQMLRHVIETPMEQLRFDDFVRLKCGCDQYSRWRHRDLACLPDYADVEAVLRDETPVLSCLRWMLRGLPMEKAIRKVQVDAEVAENARKSRAKKTRKKRRRRCQHERPTNRHRI